MTEDDELRYLRERNAKLTRLAKSLVVLATGMMDAALEDHPQLAALPYFMNGRESIRELLLVLEDTKGEA